MHNLFSTFAALFVLIPLFGGVGAFADDPPEELPTTVDLYDLTDIDWQPGKEVPKWIRDLDGERVRIGGNMHPSMGQRAAEFMLVTDACVCGGRPQPHHYVDVTLDEKVDYKSGLIDVIGTFRVEEVEENGYVVSLFHLEAERIE